MCKKETVKIFLGITVNTSMNLDVIFLKKIHKNENKEILAWLDKA